MADKPRRPRRSFQQRFDEALSNAKIDGGNYPTADEVAAGAAAPEAQKKPKRGRGRPPVHDWARIDPVLDWWLSDKSVQRLLPQAEFALSVHSWCRQEDPGKKPPQVKTYPKTPSGALQVILLFWLFLLRPAPSFALLHLS